MLQPPVTHDIRRVAAADIFKLPVDGGDTNRVRRALGHSMAAMDVGVTDAYIGRSKGDSWAERRRETSIFPVATATSTKNRATTELQQQ
jgi:hypothetical protein